LIKKISDFILFSSLYIALCAVVMVCQVQLIFPNVLLPAAFYIFIFFSTVCSYNFHWYLTRRSATGSERLQWAIKYKSLHLILYVIGLVGTIAAFVPLSRHWRWIAFGGFVTFLYSAPKIPQKIFIGLRRVAIGKTVFLAFVWMYVTTLLPLLITGIAWQRAFTWLALSRFFLIYAICILFDYRDREDDKADGIRSMITWLNERGINYLFAFSIGLFIVFTLALYGNGLEPLIIFLLLLPGIIVAAMYNYAKKNFSDYLYYFVLDGLMMLSGLLLIIVRIWLFLPQWLHLQRQGQ
jgi:4-hydroxybenzoate polyprenyltransferase